MSQLNKAAFETTYNDASTGRYKAGQVDGIGSDDHRAMIIDIKDSVLFIEDHLIDEDDMSSDSATKVPSQQSVKAYVDGRSVGLWDDRGNFDASVDDTFPSTGGSGTAGAILKGDIWTVSVAGTIDGEVVNVGDTVRAIADTPGQDDSNWAIGENNIGYTPENSTNKATDFSTINHQLYPSVESVYDYAWSRSGTTTLTGNTTIATDGYNLTFTSPISSNFNIGSGLNIFNNIHLLADNLINLSSGSNITVSATAALSLNIAGSLGTSGQVLTSDGSNATWQTPASGAISALTAAAGTNTINNAAYAQEWQWNSLAGAIGLKLSSTSTAAASNAQALLEVNLSGANATSTQTTYAGRFINTHTGTSATNVAGYFEASGGTNNYGILLHGAGTGSNKSLLYENSSSTEQFSVTDAGVGYFRAKLGVGVEPTVQFQVQGGTPQIYFTNISGTTFSEFRFSGGGTIGSILSYSSSNVTYPNLWAFNAVSRLGFMVNSTLMGEWTSDGLRIGGTTITSGNVLVDLQSSTRALLLSRISTDSNITTKVEGMHWYNSTDKAYRGYANSEVVSFLTNKTNETTKTKNEKVVRNLGTLGSGVTSTSTIQVNAYYSNKTSLFVDVDVTAVKTDGTASAFATLRSGLFRKDNSGTFTLDVAGTAATSDAAKIASVVLEVNSTNPQVKVTMGAASGDYEVSWVARTVEVKN